MFSRVRLLLTISIGLLILAACGGPVEPDTGFEVSVTVQGAGHVTSDPAGIDTADNKTSANFAENASVVLTAAPIGNATFTNWTGNAACEGSTDLVCTIDDLTADVTITANFTDDVEPGKDITYAINVVNAGGATGTVSSSTTLVENCAEGDTCEDTAAENSTVTLTAAVTSDPLTTGFAGWTGGECEGVKTLTCDVTVEDGQPAVTANFNAIMSATVKATDVVEELVNASSTDATRWPAGHNYRDSSDLDFGYDSQHGTQQWIGLRFSLPAIPAGANIKSAIVTMQAIADSSLPVTVTFHGEANATPVGFVDDPDNSGTSEASNRVANSGTTATAEWEITDTWTEDELVEFAELASIVQELANLENFTGEIVLIASPDVDATSMNSRRVVNVLDDNTAVLDLDVEYIALP